MSGDYSNVSVVVGDKWRAVSETCCVFSVLRMPRHVLASTPCKKLSSGGMRRRLDIGPYARHETANATGINFGPDHRSPVASSYSRDQVERSGIGRCIDQQITGCEPVKNRSGARRGLLTTQSNPGNVDCQAKSNGTQTNFKCVGLMCAEALRALAKIT